MISALAAMRCRTVAQFKLVPRQFTLEEEDHFLFSRVERRTFPCNDLHNGCNVMLAPLHNSNWCRDTSRQKNKITFFSPTSSVGLNRATISALRIAMSHNSNWRHTSRRNNLNTNRLYRAERDPS
jgi:hypothetical protein